MKKSNWNFNSDVNLHSLGDSSGGWFSKEPFVIGGVDSEKNGLNLGE